MLKNSMGNFFLGLLAIGLGIALMIVLPILKNIINPLVTLPLLIIGFLLIKSSFSAVVEHETLISVYFLKKMNRSTRLNIISKSILLCLFENYSEWWESQKRNGFNTNHVSFGIFIVISAGIATKKEMVKYSKHMDECHICQHYFKSWHAALLQKTKRFEK